MLRFWNKAAEKTNEPKISRTMMEPMEGRVLFSADLGGLTLTGEVEPTAATKQMGLSIPVTERCPCGKH
jgi:hypothetical protein